MNALGLASTLATTTRTAAPLDVIDVIGGEVVGARSLIEPLYDALTAAAHPDCPACSALLPVLSAYLARDITTLA